MREHYAARSAESPAGGGWEWIHIGPLAAFHKRGVAGREIPLGGVAKAAIRRLKRGEYRFGLPLSEKYVLVFTGILGDGRKHS